MAKSIEDRVVLSFRDTNKEDIAKYLEWLRESLIGAAAVVRRSITLMLLLMFIFQLIQSQANTEIALGPLKVTQSNSILYFFPTLIAYLYLEVVVYSNRFNLLTDTFAFTFSEWEKEAEKNDMDSMVTPWLPLYWNIGGGGMREENLMPHHKIEYHASYIIGHISLVGGVLFEVYAFYRLFHIYSIETPLLWVNLVLSIGLLVTAAFHYSKID